MTPDPIEAVAFFLKTARHDRDCLAVKGAHYGDESCDCGLVAARAAIAAMPKVEALAAENARLMEWLTFLADTIQQKGLGETAQLIRKKIAALTPEPDTIGYVDDTGGAR